MFSIELFDNSFKGTKISLTELDEQKKQAVRKALDLINNVSLQDLEKKGVIVFPSKTIQSELSDNKKCICSIQNLESDYPIIKTTNIMGYLSVGNEVHISIRSRFDSSKEQFFLHYMLQKACNVAPTIELIQSSKNPLYDFLVFLFPIYLKKAIAQGLFRTYVDRNYNDSNVRGVIDVPQFIQKNIPFNGKITYHTREYSNNNYLTQLIRHTIEYINEDEKIKNILSNNNETKNAVSLIRANTLLYKTSERNIIIGKNLNPLAHPFYTEYENLRKLCIMILTRNKNSYSSMNNKLVNGILFDGAALWEEYLNTVFQKQSKTTGKITIEHPNNRTGKGKKYLFDDNSGIIYPDFLVRDSENNLCSILDAKYKHLENNNIGQDDYFQVLTYMFRFKAHKGILIYPNNNLDSPNSTIRFLKEHKNEDAFFVYGFTIPQFKYETSYTTYCEEMKKREKEIIDFITSLVI